MEAARDCPRRVFAYVLTHSSPAIILRANMLFISRLPYRCLDCNRALPAHGYRILGLLLTGSTVISHSTQLWNTSDSEPRPVVPLILPRGVQR